MVQLLNLARWVELNFALHDGHCIHIPSDLQFHTAPRTVDRQEDSINPDISTVNHRVRACPSGLGFHVAYPVTGNGIGVREDEVGVYVAGATGTLNPMTLDTLGFRSRSFSTTTRWPHACLIGNSIPRGRGRIGRGEGSFSRQGYFRALVQKKGY